MNPRTYGDYEVGSMLGSGTVGLAYQARHRETGQPAVVKVLHDEAAREPDVQRRFMREVSVAEKLDHPNIVRHYDCGFEHDQIYFAMELVDSGTLKDVLQRRRVLPWREAVEVAVQICAALEHAHQLGVIHRDLKPANLFLAADGHVKVGDFGLARDASLTRLTYDGQTVGTCRYMPPEQITGEDALTGAVDLYALGCILFEMLVGRPPFDGDTVIAIFEAHLHDQPPPLAALVPDCPPDLSDLVLMLLAKKPADRPAGAAAVQAALVDILHARPMRLAPRPPDELHADMTAAAEPDAPNLTTRLHAGAGPTERQVSASRAALVFGLLAAAALLAILFATLR